AGAPVATPLAVPSPTASATPAPSRPPAEAPAPSAVRFADARNGWLGVEDGILGTSDGGRTWSRQLESERVVRISALDPRHAWALAADSTLYRTVDGSTWRSVPATTPPIREVFFIDAEVGWGIASATDSSGEGLRTYPPRYPPGTLLQTTDGGEVWRPITERSIRSVCFADRRSGWGADGDEVLTTADGGRTWRSVFVSGLEVGGPWRPSLVCDGMAAARVQLAGFGAALSHAPYVVYRTSDGGRSWTLEYAEGYTLGASLPTRVPGLGSYPSILGTLDDGRTWVVTCTPPVDGQRFHILRNDGGVEASGTIPLPSCAIAAQIIDRDHIVAVGYRASRSWLVASSDGGLTWQERYAGPAWD
ncbi:MAG: WD40/YVTN/BNR-like repeat-containing protein, partial [Candidatus Limnocylindria bacterium]